MQLYDIHRKQTLETVTITTTTIIIIAILGRVFIMHPTNAIYPTSSMDFARLPQSTSKRSNMGDNGGLDANSGAHNFFKANNTLKKIHMSA